MARETICIANDERYAVRYSRDTAKPQVDVVTNVHNPRKIDSTQITEKVGKPSYFQNGTKLEVGFSYNLVLWKDKQNEIVHYHLDLGPSKTDQSLYRDIVREAHNDISCVVSTDAIFLRLGKDAIFGMNQEEKMVAPSLAGSSSSPNTDGSWIRGTTTAYRTSFNEPPYCFEMVFGITNESIGDKTKCIVAGIRMRSEDFTEITGNVETLVKNGLSEEGLEVREIITPYIVTTMVPSNTLLFS